MRPRRRPKISWSGSENGKRPQNARVCRSGEAGNKRQGGQSLGEAGIEAVKERGKS